MADQVQTEHSNTGLWWRIALAVLAWLVLSQVITTLSMFAGMDYFFDTTYNPVWSKLMMPDVGPPPGEFFMMSMLTTIVCGAIYSIVYALFGRKLPVRHRALRGLAYGALLVCVAALPMALNLQLSVNLPFGMIMLGLMANTLIFLSGGTVTGLLVK